MPNLRPNNINSYMTVVSASYSKLFFCIISFNILPQLRYNTHKNAMKSHLNYWNILICVYFCFFEPWQKMRLFFIFACYICFVVCFFHIFFFAILRNKILINAIFLCFEKNFAHYFSTLQFYCLTNTLIDELVEFGMLLSDFGGTRTQFLVFFLLLCQPKWRSI